MRKCVQWISSFPFECSGIVSQGSHRSKGATQPTFHRECIPDRIHLILCLLLSALTSLGRDTQGYRRKMHIDCCWNYRFCSIQNRPVWWSHLRLSEHFRVSYHGRPRFVCAYAPLQGSAELWWVWRSSKTRRCRPGLQDTTKDRRKDSSQGTDKGTVGFGRRSAVAEWKESTASLGHSPIR